MADGSVHTAQLLDWLDRMRAGDRAARDELLRAVGVRGPVRSVALAAVQAVGLVYFRLGFYSCLDARIVEF